MSEPVHLNPKTESPPRSITVETERLRLTSLDPSDLDDVMTLLCSPIVLKYTSLLPHTDRTRGEKWLHERALSPDAFNFCIRLRDESQPGQKGTFVGVLGSPHAPSCGYLLHPDHHNKGYATEALLVFVSTYFTHITAYDYIKAGTDLENVASGRVLQKAGFVQTHVAKADFKSPTRGTQDSLWWCIARPGMRVEDLGIKFGEES